MASYLELDTPALLVDKTVMERNIAQMMAKARQWGVKLRPHTKTHRDLRLKKVYDEHGVLEDAGAAARLKLGDKVEVIPNHACPTCNLYDKIHVVDNGEVIDEWPILCRGKSQ